MKEMNLEQIDTSTTAGKAEIMRLAAEGRRVAIGPHRSTPMAELANDPSWDWKSNTYGRIAELDGPEELWVVDFNGHFHADDRLDTSKQFAESVGGKMVRYIRADLAGEKG